MLSEEGDDLHSVLETDDAHAASPSISITVRLNQIPPQAHLLFERWAHGIENIFAPGILSRIPNETRVLVRVAVEASRRRRIVGEESAARKLARGARDDAIKERAVFQQSQLIADAGDARS